MADFTVTGDTSLDASGANKGFDAIGKGFSGAASVGVSAAKGLLTVMAGVTTAIAGVGVAAVKYNANLEQYSTSFEVMTGSAEKAMKVVDDLKTMGAKTPFEFEDLAKGTQTLMSFGRTVDESKTDLMMLGDISQGNAGKLETLTRAFGKMTSSGKVSLEDINMMIDSGFNPLQEIVETTGESMSGLYERISAGTISVDEITAAMSRSTAEGGKYFESMEKQSQTINGQLATLKDNAMSLVGEVFSGVTEAVGTEVLPLANGWIEELSTAFKEGGVTQLVEAFGGVLAEVITKAAEAAPQMLQVATNVIVAFAQGLSANSGQISTAFIGILGALGEAVLTAGPALLTAAANIVGGLITGLMAQGPNIQASAMGILEQIKLGINSAGASGMIDSGIQTIGSFLTGLAEALPDVLMAALDILLALSTALAENFPTIVEAGIGAIVSFIGGIYEKLPEIFATASKIVGNLLEGLISSIPYLLIGIAKLTFAMFKGFLSVDWGEVGLNIITGIAKGIGNAVKVLVDAAVNAAKAAFQAAKEFLGIASPSKLYEKEIGERQIQGQIKGIENLTPDLIKASVESARLMVAEAQATINNSQAEASIGIVPTAGTSVSNQSNIYQYFYSKVTSPYDAYKRAVGYVL